LILAGCSTNENNTVQPNFFTATLPPTSTIQPAQQPTSTLMPEQPVVNLPPVEGITTSQLNVRSVPSTIGDALGTIAAFSTVQIVGKESNGAWYQILYQNSSDGKGWITSAYVQVSDTAQIPVIQTGAGPGTNGSGITLQGVNVRNGPGTSYESIGTLLKNDVVQITGKDSNGDWVQIDFKGSAGWISSDYLQADLTNVPVVANEVTVETPEAVTSFQPSMQDNDSVSAPSASLSILSTTKSFQVSGLVSPADVTDWIGITTSGLPILVKVKCDAAQVATTFLENGQTANALTIPCNTEKIFQTRPGPVYNLQITATTSTPTLVSPYSVQVKPLK